MKVLNPKFFFFLFALLLALSLGACKPEEPIEPEPEVTPIPEPEVLTVAEAYATLEPIIGTYDFTTTIYMLDINGDEVRDTIDYQGDIVIEDTLSQRIRVYYRPNRSFSWRITENRVVGSCYSSTFRYDNNRVRYMSYKYSSGTPCSMGIVRDERQMTGDKL